MCCSFSAFSHDDSRELVHEFRHRTLVLVKALILQKKASALDTHFQLETAYLIHSFSRYYFMGIQLNDCVHINTR